MAKRDERNPNSNRERVLAWLREHPGHHRCCEIAPELGIETHAVAIACYALAEKRADPEVVRGERAAAKAGARPFKTYAYAESVGASRENEIDRQPAENRST